MSTAKQRERDDAIARLREILEPGDTVWTVLRHVSRSGMTRHIDAYKLATDDRWVLSYNAAKAMGRRLSKTDEVVMEGCGMDMGFALVYDLGMSLWPDGFDCIGEGCPSNDHSNHHQCRDRDNQFVTDDDGLRVGPLVVECGNCHNQWCERCDPAPSALCHWCHGRGYSTAIVRAVHHSSGGYALKHRWL